MIKKPFIALQYKFFVFSLLLVLVPLLTLGYVSYTKSAQIIQDKVSSSNLKTVEQTGNNIDFVLNDLFTTSIFLLQSQEITTMFKLPAGTPLNVIEKSKLDTQRFLAYLSATKDYIYSFYLEGYNGVTLDTLRSNFQLSDEQRREVESLNGSNLWSSQPIVDYDASKRHVFSVIRVMKDINRLSDRLGILKLNIKEEKIAAIYHQNPSEIQSEFLIIDQHKIILSSLDKNQIGMPLEDGLIPTTLGNASSGYYEVSKAGKDYLVTYYHLKNTQWTLINIVALEALVKDNFIILNTTYIIIFIAFVICSLFSYMFFTKILSPLKQVRVLMKELERENYDIHMELVGNDEITLLGQSFNKMSTRLKEVRNQVYLSKIKQREAELIALQAQINPHFLYNTLDTIYWSARLEKAFDSAKLVQALSNMFRLSLNSGQEMTTVEREMLHLKNYIIIQEMRYKGQITFNIAVDPETLDCPVIKLILQPIVENAIYHGIEKNGGTGQIDIQIYRQDNALIYQVMDNGIGADTEALNALLLDSNEHAKGFAIKNVNDRIQLFFGEHYGLQFYPNTSGGTKVIVTQVFRTSKEVLHEA